MAPSPYGNATLREKLGAVLTLCLAMIKAASVPVRLSLVSDPEAQQPLKREMDRTIIRTLVTKLNPAQMHWLFPGSTAAYESWIARRAKKEGAPAEVVTELIGDDGAKLHWIGDKDAKKVILHFHSGGFVCPLNNGHLSFINYLRRDSECRSSIRVKAAFLEYSLSPIAVYPTQYQQAVRALQHILNSGISPADILITGDSAGGMLALQLISQYLHPHASIPALSIPPVPFAGFLAVAPWVTFDVDASSFLNNERDILSPEGIREWGGLMLKGKVPPDNKGQPEEFWREPLKAPQEWWDGTEKVTQHVMFVVGEWEILRDDILSFVKEFKQGVAGDKVDIVLREDPNGIHIAPFLDASNGRPPSDTANLIAAWVHDRLVV